MGIDYIRCWMGGAALLWLAVVLPGCASTGTAPGHAIQEQGRIETAKGWWYARFFIEWPEKADPSWHIDLLLAHKVISPLLYQYKDHLTLWRFHRRAARDPSGHQFSFIFYSSPETANKIYALLRSDPLLEVMKQNGTLLREHYDDTRMVLRPNIEDTSDPNWSPPIKKAWPYYIMGVSQMWLNLITEISNALSEESLPASLEEHLTFYRQVRASVKASWQEEGHHAFLHHINALFGYEPVFIIRRDLQVF